MKINQIMPGRLTSLITIICLAVLIFPAGVLANPQVIQGTGRSPTNAMEVPSPVYDSILYSEIEPLLRQIERSSNRVKVDVIGQSAGGRDLFLVTLASPESMGRLGRYKAIRNLMLKDPEKAQELIEKFGDIKVPFFINASIHGNEYPGVDAAIRLIETLAYQDTPEVQKILDNIILLVNVVQNPDGRVLGTRSNANGFDINRDFITQSQPETRATVSVLTEWNPMVVLDLHGFVNPMLIEPCTPLHNPNYEYDLYIKWAYYEAEAMEAELLANTGFTAQIPFRDDELGWDDWPPTYTPMYSMYHGAYGHTLETPYRDERGVDAHYWASWGALKFAAQNREAMIYDQIEIFKRGFLALPQMLIPDELLNETQYDQYNELTIQEFPAAYVIPAGEPFQLSPVQPARLINFLLYNDVQVEKTTHEFTLNGLDIPAGSYVVWMNQPKRGLANTILDSGRDLSNLEGLTFYSPPSVWSNPLLWGVNREVMVEPMQVSTTAVDRLIFAQGSLEPGLAGYYAFQPASLTAFQAVNWMLKSGYEVYRASSDFDDLGYSYGAGTFIIPADLALAGHLVGRFALEFQALQNLPEDVARLKIPRIAVYGDEGTRYALGLMGFDAVAFSTGEFNSSSILDYDLFVNQSGSWSSLGNRGREAFSQFFMEGGDYVGLRSNGVSFALQAGILDADAAGGSGNAIVKLAYNASDSLSAGFWENDSAFVNGPVWFTRLGDGVETTAYLPREFMVSGFWPKWEASGASEMPVIVHQSTGQRHAAVLGIDATFRGHPENTFRLIGNAIFASQE
jgi:hypothetical protein